MNKTDKQAIDSAIAELVYNKIKIKKAYQYYQGYRDAEQYRHLEENYGIGTPTSVTFTPLIKKHIDVLVGEYLGLDPELKVSCKDSQTVSNIIRDKQLKLNKEVFNFLKNYLQNILISVILENKEATNDPLIEKQLQKLKTDIDLNFVSDYEIAAQNILTYIKQSRNIDLKYKMKELFLDLLISGTCYYRTKRTAAGNNITLQVLNPLHTFVERNPNSPYLKDCRRAVIRRYLSKEEIINEFRDVLTPEAIQLLKEKKDFGDYDSSAVFVRVPTGALYDNNGTITQASSTGILGGLEVSPLLTFDNADYNYNYNLIPVYEVEWIDVDIKTKRLTRKEGIRIGADIYITKGEAKDIIRTSDDPNKCTLSINGTFYLGKNGEPFSLILSTMDLQDKYDLLIFFRDNLIAQSGSKGQWVNIAAIPTYLGNTPQERLQRWMGYLKSGLGLIDPSQDDIDIGNLNTIYNGFDNTVRADSIQAIQIAIQAIEQQASSITGVFQEKLGDIEQRDAVSNVKVGIKNSTLITKQYFNMMDIMYKEINYDLLNLAKIVYKDGITGTLILGDKRVKTFTALPEYYTLTDFDVHIDDSGENYIERTKLETYVPELIKSGLVDTNMIMDIVSAKSMTELKRNINVALKSKEEQNNIISQYQQQIQQYEQALKQCQQQIQTISNENNKLQKELNNNNKEQLELDKKRVQLEEQKIRDTKDYNDKMVNVKKEQLQTEIMQTYDASPYNDKIKNTL